MITSQSATIEAPKSTIETPDEGAKYVQNYQNDTMFWCLYC